jgi:ubiquitin-protein ligase E3 C
VPSKHAQRPQSAISSNYGPHFGEAYSTSPHARLLDSPSEIWNDPGLGLTTLPYATAEQCFAQLRLLVHFIDVKLETDRMRLLFFGHNLNDTLHTLPSIATGDRWTLELARLGRLTLDLTQVLINHQQGEIRYDGLHGGLHDQLDQLLNLLTLLANLIPREIALHAQQYYHVLAEIIHKWGSNIPPATRELTLEALRALLKPIGSSTVTVYGTMAMQLLTMESLTSWTDFELFCSTFNHKLLAKSLSHVLERQGQWRHWSPTNTPERHTSEREGLLWLLAHFIYIHRRAEGQEMSVAEETDFIRVVAVFLDYLGDDIVARSDLQNNSGNSNGAPSPLSPRLASNGPLPRFVREQIDSLRRQQSITSILSYMGGSPATSNPESDEASLSKVLAGYALTLLRVFPAKADEIRMWLYRGSSNMKRSSGSSAVEYFWYASRNSTLFNDISRSYKSVPALLKGPRDQTDQIGRAPPSAQDIDAWSQEWNVILLFLELYTFVLKFMDDEEFLSGDKPPINGLSPRRIEPVRDGVLPIREIADMTVFLKNLAFALYWNAAELIESSEQTDNDASVTILGISPSSNPTFSNSKKLQREGQLSTTRLPLQHLKGLVTGLLRMLHERDSRRTVFSKDHWLMTSQLDLMGFIPAVVAEEERRNEIHEHSDEGEEDIDDFVENSDLLNNATGWSRPNLVSPSLPDVTVIRFQSAQSSINTQRWSFHI